MTSDRWLQKAMTSSSGEVFVGEQQTMRVVSGFPENVITRIPGEIFSAEIYALQALFDSRTPTPPCEAFDAFFQPEDVISVYYGEFRNVQNIRVDEAMFLQTNNVQFVVAS